MPRYLDPKSDLVFKKIFGKHPHLLKSFLNALLPLPEDSVIESLEYLNAENVPEIPILKRTIVDVRCTDQKGRQFIVEMQMEWVPAFIQRVLFNASSLYVKQLGKGEHYKTLNHVYGLALLAHDFRPEDPNWIHHYKMTHQQSSDALDDIQLVFVELAKFQAKTTTMKRLAVLWIRFLLEISENTKTIDQELLSVPEIHEAIELSEHAAYSRAELDAYDGYWDSVSTETTLLEGKFALGVEKGRQEGRQEGIEESKIDIAINLLAAGMDVEFIEKTTHLPLEKIKELKGV
jgi:predicted transposase/invertase (TIGR01784 family)